MKQIEEGLHRVHAEAREMKAQLAPQQPMEVETTGSCQVGRQPIVKVDRVDEGSPAANAVSLIHYNIRPCQMSST